MTTSFQQCDAISFIIGKIFFLKCDITDPVPKWRELLYTYSQEGTMHGIRNITLQYRYNIRRSYSFKIIQIGLFIFVHIISVINTFTLHPFDQYKAKWHLHCMDTFWDCQYVYYNSGKSVLSTKTPIYSAVRYIQYYFNTSYTWISSFYIQSSMVCCCDDSNSMLPVPWHQ